MPDISLRFAKDVLVVEGPLKTALVRQGMPADECAEFNNVLDPELIYDIQRFDLLSGVHCLVSNTYAGTENALAPFGLEERTDELNHAGMQIVRRLSAQHILAGIGPCGLIEDSAHAHFHGQQMPQGQTTLEELYDETCRQYSRQIETLVQSGPEALLFKGLADLDEVTAALKTARRLCGLPIILCAYCDTATGEVCGLPIEQAAVAFEGLGADFIGICGDGPAQLIEPFRHLAAVSDLPLIVMMDVGTSHDYEGFPVTGNAMGTWARTFRDSGANLIGTDEGSSPAVSGSAAATVGGMDVVRHGR